MNKRILEKFFNNKASEAEVQKVLEWFDTQKLNPQKIQSLEELWDQIDESDFVSHNPEQILRNIHQEIDTSDAKQNVAEKKPVKTLHQQGQSLLIWGSVAAILIVVGIFSFRGAGDWQPGKEKEQITKIAEMGQKKMLTLADGTEIHLNAGSSITFPEQFSVKKREVVLSGEAFFKVKEDSARPFIVQTKNLSTTVLGTSFNVRSYDNDQQSDVSLVTGKLKVQPSDTTREATSYVLAPGEAVVLDKRNNTLEQTRFDTGIRLGWTEGVLVFENAGKDEIITRIERWYGVTIKVENREKSVDQQWKYRGIFKDESLEDVLKGISYVKNFTYQIENQTVTITF
ncbi:FecR family protein [Fodinibius salsisoli]|uniref:FecR domain-containing protein n=1 Tax=Fodinibius salsisoli TaxID=2820877 RepID=A0ABT3PLJ5_9BACT|nr:FecR family protein [Fodinibius salsisoli]MCW9706633.1 FecR domain-containing protein [Fodinibius salsisoli]